MEIPDYGPQYRDRHWAEPQKGLAAMISRLDADVGMILDKLKGLGLDEKTVVMFSSDNGPHKEGGNDPEFFDSNGPLRGHKRDLYEGGIRVPFIVRWPGHVPAGTVSDLVGSVADFLPTAAEIAGTKSPDGLDGRSLLSAIRGEESRSPHEYLYWEFYERGSAQAVRMGNWKGVVQPFGSDQLELYDLSADPGEQTDVAAGHPDVVEKIRAAMQTAHTPSPHW